MRMDEYAPPRRDNGRRMYWFPTLGQSRGIIDRFISELHRVRIRCALILSRMDQRV